MLLQRDCHTCRSIDTKSSPCITPQLARCICTFRYSHTILDLNNKFYQHPSQPLPTTHTQTHTHSPSFPKCVHDCKSFSRMYECLLQIHHLPFPPPLTQFLYQPAVTQTIEHPLHNSFLCFCFFSLPTAPLALLVWYTVLMVLMHAFSPLMPSSYSGTYRSPSSTCHFSYSVLPFHCLLSTFLSTYLSLSCAPLGPEWYLQSGPIKKTLTWGKEGNDEI